QIGGIFQGNKTPTPVGGSPVAPMNDKIKNTQPSGNNEKKGDSPKSGNPGKATSGGERRTGTSEPTKSNQQHQGNPGSNLRPVDSSYKTAPTGPSHDLGLGQQGGQGGGKSGGELNRERGNSATKGDSGTHKIKGGDRVK
ncbi:MAG: hypothetical protein EBZ77_02865, partial [Chitinophagia bacterium]|nr:hypothetical protein [Chitinophagia bacterium]